MTSGVYPRKPLRERFETRFLRGSPDECWEWLGTKLKKGYGQIRGVGEDVWMAHRLAFFLAYGSLPRLLMVCHRCDNPSCVNPGHLFLGTAKDNVQDMMVKGRWHGGLKKSTHCKIGHLLSADNLRISGKKRTCRTCRLAFERERRAARRSETNESR